jgi:hypothetical protein
MALHTGPKYALSKSRRVHCFAMLRSLYLYMIRWLQTIKPRGLVTIACLART